MAADRTVAAVDRTVAAVDRCAAADRTVAAADRCAAVVRTVAAADHCAAVVRIAVVAPLALVVHTARAGRLAFLHDQVVRGVQCAPGDLIDRGGRISRMARSDPFP